MPSSKITSLTNPKIKEVIRLRDNHHRKISGLTIVEGAREILQANKANCEVLQMYYCPDYCQEANLTQWAQKDTDIFEVTEEVYEKIGYGSRKEGVLAVAKVPQLTLKDIPKKNNFLLVVIESIEKPGNLGAILRSCDGADVDGVIICNAKTDPYNPNCIRSSLGAIFTRPIVISDNGSTLEYLKANNISICATTPSAKKDYSKIDLTKSTAIVLGSEDRGLSEFWLKEADELATIPMKGQLDSLNVAAVTAIFLYEALRQRN